MTTNAPDIDRTTATGLTRYAFEYIEAARIVRDEYDERDWPRDIPPMPAYFLAYHGIELTLKAYLRHRGLSVKELSGRKYGHDLHACYKKALELGLNQHFPATENDKAVLASLVSLNTDHGLRYIKTGPKEAPYWHFLEPFAVRLHQAVAPLTGYRSFEDDFSNAQ